MYESYRKTELPEEKAWFWQKNIILTFTTFIFLLHQRLLLPSPCHDQENSFFHFFPMFTTLWSKEKKIICLLRSLRHNLKVKKYFFHLVTTFNTPWSREKPFFHFGTTFNTTWSQKKKFDFYWITTLTTLRPWKNVIFFNFTGTFTMEISSYMILHLLTMHTTSLTCRKFPNDILPGKKHVHLKKLSSSGISVETLMIHVAIIKYLKTCSKMFHISKKCGKNASETCSEG